VQLLSSGIIDPDLHYGIHAKAWWFQASKDSNNISFWNPVCIGMKTQFTLNNKSFMLRVIKGNKVNILVILELDLYLKSVNGKISPQYKYKNYQKQK